MSKLDNSDPRNVAPTIGELCPARDHSSLHCVNVERPFDRSCRRTSAPSAEEFVWDTFYFLPRAPVRRLAGVAMCPSVCRIMLCIIKYQYSRSTLRGSIIVYIYNLYLVCHYLIGEKLRAPILKLHSDIEMLLLFLRAALCGLGRAAACGAAEQLIRHIRLVPQIG